MKRFFAQKWSAVLLVAVLLSLVGGIVFATTKDAQYTLYWKDSDKNALKAIFDDGEKQDQIGDKMVIVAKGIPGDQFDDKGVIFNFDPGVNNQLNKHSPDTSSDNYYATTKVYCKGDTLSVIKPTTEPYEAIDYTLGFHVDNWNGIQNEEDYDLYAGVTKIKKVGGTGTADEETFAKASKYTSVTGQHYFNPTKLGDDGDHGGHGGDAKDHMSEACFNALSRGHIGQLYNWWKLTSASDKAAIKAIAENTATPGGGAGGSGGGGGSGAAGPEDTPCLGGALGWVLCPLINIMADAIRAVASFIDSMMQFRLLVDTSPTGSGSTIRGYWLNFVGLANILLVIAFLVVIYSQATGAGLSNYNIKRMLPRIVIAAIMINLSFYICALAIDITNIVGNATIGLLTGNSTGVSEGIANTTQLKGPSTFQNATAGLLGAAIGVILVIIFIVPLLIGVIITFVILIARQVILLALILVSPLAFAAWLLPNTEQYFKKWRKLFTDMLMAYPIVMGVFGIALFSSKFIAEVARSSDQSHSTDLGLNNDNLAAIISLVVLAVPLLALPFILKSASSMLAKVGQAAQQYGGNQAKSKFHGKSGAAVKRLPGIRTGAEMFDEFGKGRKERHERGVKSRQAARLTRGGFRGNVARRVAGGFSQEGQARALAGGIAGQTKEASEAAQNAEFLLGGSRAAAEAIAAGHTTLAGANIALAAAGDPILQGSDAEAFERLNMAGGGGTAAGARAAMTVLAKTGGLTHDTIRNLNQQALAGAHTPAERAAVGRELSEHLNHVATENGYGYLGESTSDAAGNILQGQQRAGQANANGTAPIHESIVTELASKGASGVRREMWLDQGDAGTGVAVVDGNTGATRAQTVSDIAAQHAHDQMNHADPNQQRQFRVDLSKADDRKVLAMAQSMHRAGLMGNMTVDQAHAHLRDQRDQGRRESNQP